MVDYGAKCGRGASGWCTTLLAKMAENTTDSAGKTKIATGGPTGKFYHGLDQKKRLTIPSEWRRAWGDPECVYVYTDLTRECLIMVPPAEMDKLRQKLDAASILDSEALAIASDFFECTQQIVIDSAGRIRINDDLMALVGIKTKVTLRGALRNVEIWATDKLPEPADGKKLNIAAAREAMRKIMAMK